MFALLERIYSLLFHISAVSHFKTVQDALGSAFIKFRDYCREKSKSSLASGESNTALFRSWWKELEGTYIQVTCMSTYVWGH